MLTQPSASVSKLFHICFSQLSYHSNTIISVKKGEIKKMKNWKIITFVSVAAIVAALLASSAFAMGMMGGGDTVAMAE